MTRAPYNTEEYLEGFDGQVDDDDTTGLIGFKQQVVYKQGGLNLDYVFERQLDPFFTQLNGLLNVSRGLTILHNKGMAHLDLKPDNCIKSQNDVGQSTYKLIDFSRLCYVGEPSVLRNKIINTLAVFYMFKMYPSFLSAGLYLVNENII